MADPASAKPPSGSSGKAWQHLVAIKQNFQDLANAQTATTTAIRDLTRQLADLATALNSTPTIPPAVVPSPAPAVVVELAPIVMAPKSCEFHACLLLLAMFTGDHSDGRWFIQACKLYFTMAPASHFALHTRAIGWALIQIQEGCSANYVECVVQEEITQFTSWDNFWDCFAWEFYKADMEATTSLTLELEAYYQHEHDIDLHPDDTQVEAWMTAACKQAFIIKTEANFTCSWFPAKTAKQVPTFAPGQILVASPCFLLAAPALAPSQPLFPSLMVHIALVLVPAALKSLPMGMLMDINKMHAACMAEVICHRCSQKGHYKQDCLFCHHLHFMDDKAKDELTMQLLAQQDMLAAESQAATSDDSDIYV
ncbi:hypothetical protein DXG03_002006 [Asterophora parasitica]|uniref:CCHC-type domain-containing protein n=1 Tax=Asterophora parasitica TaxID=117018 RepID=A0A9P7GGJ1_9AGAR|nr:hypothetical protein DXG03_002006 [Asterophora parasitica]